MSSLRSLMCAVMLAGCDTAMVGGECLEGWENVDGSCVRETFDGEGGEAPSVPAMPLAVWEGQGGTGGGPRSPKTAGHVVVMGLDPSMSETGRTVLANAVTLSQHEPVRVAVIEAHDGLPGSGAMAPLVGQLVAARGRSTTLMAPDASVPPAEALAETVDVVVLHGSALARGRDFAGGWDRELGQLTRRAGVVIVVAPPATAELTAAFVSSAGLLPGLQPEPVKDDLLAIAVWTDALAVGAVSPFHSATWVTGFSVPEGADAVPVAVASEGPAVLWHRAVPPDDAAEEVEP